MNEKLVCIVMRLERGLAGFLQAPGRGGGWDRGSPVPPGVLTLGGFHFGEQPSGSHLLCSQVISPEDLHSWSVLGYMCCLCPISLPLFIPGLGPRCLAKVSHPHNSPSPNLSERGAQSQKKDTSPSSGGEPHQEPCHDRPET